MYQIHVCWEKKWLDKSYSRPKRPCDPFDQHQRLWPLASCNLKVCDSLPSTKIWWDDNQKWALYACSKIGSWGHNSWGWPKDCNSGDENEQKPGQKLRRRVTQAHQKNWVLMYWSNACLVNIVSSVLLFCGCIKKKKKKYWSNAAIKPLLCSHTPGIWLTNVHRGSGILHHLLLLGRGIWHHIQGGGGWCRGIWTSYPWHHQGGLGRAVINSCNS